MLTKKRTAFTLIELLVVIAIIGVLVSLLLPAVQKVRDAAARLQCSNNLKQMGLALHHFHDVNLSLPPGYVASGPYADGANDTSPGWGWAAFILPFLEQGPLHRQIDFTAPVQSSPAAAAILQVFLCPSDQLPTGTFAVTDAFGNTICQAGPSSYAACVGGDETETTAPYGQGIFFRNSRVRLLDITDGTSDTIMAGDRAWGQANGIWAGAISGSVCLRGAQNPNPGSQGAFGPAPDLILAHSHLNNALGDTDAGLDDFSSFHSGGSNFLFADGSVRFLRSVSYDNPDGTLTSAGLTFQSLGTRAGGEIIDNSEF